MGSDDTNSAAGEVALRTRAFVRDVVIPVERKLDGNVHDGPEDVRIALQDAARAAGVFAPQVPTDLGGLGLDRTAQSAVFEEAGYSLLGPLALNCAAPDEGNLHLLGEVASAEQKERYLRPLAAGAIRSCFAMTEPAPGVGSDPSMLRTRAEQLPGGDWSITGRKWFITGGIGASVTICMARTSGEPGDRRGATMFLIDRDSAGMSVERNIGTLDVSLFGGHAEIVFDDCRVGPDAVLGDVGRGFELAQVRLAPARLTHCMRWLGIARRSHEISMAWTQRREAFGRPLRELGMIQQLVADSEIDITACRALIRECAAQLDRGVEAGHLSSITKTFVSEAVGRVVDRAVQICGSLGVSEDVMLGRFLREVRPFRIYDGPSETHRWSVARRAIKAIDADAVLGHG
jgi:acyl-CoA dehydrogenase